MKSALSLSRLAGRPACSTSAVLGSNRSSIITSAKRGRPKSVAPAADPVEVPQPPPAKTPNAEVDGVAPVKKSRTKRSSSVLPTLEGLPWANQQDAGQQEQELKAYVASRGETSSSRRRSKSTAGNAAVVGDQVMRGMQEKTVKFKAGTNQPFVDRTSFGEGKEHWWAIAVYEGKEKQFKEKLLENFTLTPYRPDPSTGAVEARVPLEVLVPLRKEYTYNEATKRKTSKTVKYKDGGFVFLKGVLTYDNLSVLEGTMYFRHFVHSTQWRYDFEQEISRLMQSQLDVTLPLPAPADMMQEVFAWLEEKQESTIDDAAEQDDSIDKQAENMDVNEAGELVYKRDYAGTYTNPSNWFDGSAVEPAAAAAPAATPSTRGRRKTAAPVAAEPAAAQATAEPVVKASTRGRRKTAVPEAAEPEPAAAQPAEPLVKASTRGRRKTAIPEVAEPEPAAAQAAEPVSVPSTRGRRKSTAAVLPAEPVPTVAAEATTTPSTRGRRKSTAPIVAEETQEPAPVTQPAVTPSTRGRRKTAAPVEGPPAAAPTEVPAEPPAQVQPAVATTATPSTRGRRKTAAPAAPDRPAAAAAPAPTEAPASKPAAPSSKEDNSLSAKAAVAAGAAGAAAAAAAAPQAATPTTPQAAAPTSAAPSQPQKQQDVKSVGRPGMMDDGFDLGMEDLDGDLGLDFDMEMDSMFAEPVVPAGRGQGGPAPAQQLQGRGQQGGYAAGVNPNTGGYLNSMGPGAVDFNARGRSTPSTFDDWGQDDLFADFGPLDADDGGYIMPRKQGGMAGTGFSLDDDFTFDDLTDRDQDLWAMLDEGDLDDMDGFAPPPPAGFGGQPWQQQQRQPQQQVQQQQRWPQQQQQRTAAGVGAQSGWQQQKQGTRQGSSQQRDGGYNQQGYNQQGAGQPGSGQQKRGGDGGYNQQQQQRGGSGSGNQQQYPSQQQGRNNNSQQQRGPGGGYAPQQQQQQQKGAGSGYPLQQQQGRNQQHPPSQQQGRSSGQQPQRGPPRPGHGQQRPTHPGARHH